MSTLDLSRKPMRCTSSSAYPRLIAFCWPTSAKGLSLPHRWAEDALDIHASQCLRAQIARFKAFWKTSRVLNVTH